MANAARILAEAPPPFSREIDAATLRACRTGEAHAVRAFVLHYQRPVLAFLSRSLGSALPIEDLAQEVFVRAAAALADFDVEGTARVSTWLLTIARRLCIDFRREQRVRAVPITDQIAVDTATPEAERTRQELGRALAAATARLPDDQRSLSTSATGLASPPIRS